MKDLNVKMPQRLDYNISLENLAKWNKQHKALLEISDKAGCYYCCRIFPASDIKEWVRSFRRKGETPDCALCPYCGIDAVLPDVAVDLSVDLLKEMYTYWFDSSSVAFRVKDGEIVDIFDDEGKYDPTEFAKWRKEQLEVFNENKKERKSKIISNFLQKRLDN